MLDRRKLIEKLFEIVNKTGYVKRWTYLAVSNLVDQFFKLCEKYGVDPHEIDLVALFDPGLTYQEMLSILEDEIKSRSKIKEYELEPQEELRKQLEFVEEELRNIEYQTGEPILEIAEEYHKIKSLLEQSRNSLVEKLQKEVKKLREENKKLLEEIANYRKKLDAYEWELKALRGGRKAYIEACRSEIIKLQKDKERLIRENQALYKKIYHLEKLLEQYRRGQLKPIETPGLKEIQIKITEANKELKTTKKEFYTELAKRIAEKFKQYANM